MDDIADLLECEEMKSVVAAIEALKRRYSKSSSSGYRTSFSQLVSGRFPAHEILEILAGEDAGYPGQKDVLAAAFSAWLLFPKDKGIRQNWMIDAILHHMDQAEYEAGFSENIWTLERDVISRYLLIDERFLRDMYDEAGGYQAFKNIDSLDTLDIILEHDLRTIRTAARSVFYIHHGANLYRENGNYYRPSVNRSSKVFEKIRISESISHRNTADKRKTPNYTYVARSSLHKIWGESKGALTLIYAASCLPATRKKSLLDVLIRREFSYAAHGSLIPKWRGMARYVADAV
ncbi:MAG: hypothetical protein ACTHKQ_03850, partial [Mesorhizobium sp.]